MSRKLDAKAALIETPVLSRHSREQGVQAAQSRPRTAIGSMAQFVATQAPIQQEVTDLREKVKQFDGAEVVKHLDPKTVRPSKWANRHEDAFKAAEFEAFKAEIRASGGNVQPIKVRVLNGSTLDSEAQYEVVFGHRRHRACLDEELPVKALIESVDDASLFVQMERENRGRQNLSAWEQGRMYDRALQEGLFKSLRELSKAIDVDPSIISKSIAVAQLPASVVSAFQSPLDIQFRWAKPLRDCLERDPDGILSRAKHVKQVRESKAIGASEIFSKLIAIEPAVKGGLSVNPIRHNGKRVGEVSFDATGKVLLKIDPNVIPRERLDAFKELIESFVSKS